MREGGRSEGLHDLGLQRRIAALKIQNADAGPAPSAVGYRCAGLESQPVTAVYYSSTEPQSAVVTVGDRQVIAFIAPAASGARYAAKDVELWEHQGEATVRWSGKDCARNETMTGFTMRIRLIDGACASELLPGDSICEDALRAA